MREHLGKSWHRKNLCRREYFNPPKARDPWIECWLVSAKIPSADAWSTTSTAFVRLLVQVVHFDVQCSFCSDTFDAPSEVVANVAWFPFVRGSLRRLRVTNFGGGLTASCGFDLVQSYFPSLCEVRLVSTAQTSLVSAWLLPPSANCKSYFVAANFSSTYRDSAFRWWPKDRSQDQKCQLVSWEIHC